MSFGVYVHIPYCLQRCTYCDFATYVESDTKRLKLPPPSEYISLLSEEIRQFASAHPKGKLSTVYFGGGTPSLLPAEMIVAVLDELEKHGFETGPETEITLEINPATIDPQKMEIYLKRGVNRFSVGAQTFDDRLLKMVNREHNASQTRETLRILQEAAANYSFDLLFALPTQTMDGLKRDLDEVAKIDPPHISPYCLTVPENHILSPHRPEDDIQVEMFDLIYQRLKQLGHRRYEISNFSKPGFESRHNSIYWSDDPYWGLGLSSHSYSKETSWGVRYWNPKSLPDYVKQIESHRGQQFKRAFDGRPEEQFEILELNQALTDFCHISLRRDTGLNQRAFIEKFGKKLWSGVSPQFEQLRSEGYLDFQNENYALSERGVVLSNQVFARLTYLPEDLPPT